MSELFLTAYRGHYFELKRFLQRRLGSASDAEDVAQEAYIKLASAPDVTSELHARAFLFRVAENLAIDELRKRQVRVAASSDEFASGVARTRPAAPEEIVHARDRLDRLRKAIAQLPPKCRQVFILHKIHHLSHKQIALKLGISINAIEGHIARGLTHCRNADREQAQDRSAAVSSDEGEMT